MGAKVVEEVKTEKGWAAGRMAGLHTSVLSYRPEILMFTARLAPSGRALFCFGYRLYEDGQDKEGVRKQGEKRYQETQRKKCEPPAQRVKTTKDKR